MDHGRRRALRTIGAAASTGLAGCVSEPPSMLVGVFVSEGAASPTRRALARREAWLGHRPPVVTLFTGTDLAARATRERTLALLSAVWEGGSVPLLTWEPFVADPDPGPIERGLAEGVYDDLLESWFASLEEWVLESEVERRLYFRPAHEMNGDWYPWAGTHPEATPADYVAMWRTLHDRLMARVDPEHVRWIWSPNHADVGGHPAEAYYPGDDYVDWLGVDGYNWGSMDEGWRSPEAVFGPMLDRLDALADAPLAVAEFATTSAVTNGFDPARKAAWIEEAFDFLAGRGVAMANWFDVDKETDWAVLGGARGTDRVEIDGADRPAYDAYRRAVTESVDAIGPAGPRVLDDDRFASGR